MSVYLAIAIVLALVLANGFFVALEFALVAVDRSKLRAKAEAGSWAAKHAVRILSRLSFHLSGAQLGITVTSLVLGFLTDSVVRDLLAPLYDAIPAIAGATASALVALGVATVFQLVVGELIPKNVAIAKPVWTSLVLAPAATIVNGILSPFIWVFNSAANAMVRRLGLEPKEELSDHVSIEDLAVLASDEKDGPLSSDAKELLTKTIKFGGKTAADALTPRPQVVYTRPTTTVRDLLRFACEKTHSTFPVVGEDIDDVVGVVSVVSAFEVANEDREATTVAEIMSEPFVVPETRELVDTLNDFRAPRHEMAIVADEHGGTAGILTLEDVLEEIVGEVDDEYDEVTSLTQGTADHTFYVAGTASVDEVNETCGCNVPDGDYETIAGFLLSELGEVPEPGAIVQRAEWTFEVVEMDSLRIASIQVAADDDGREPQ